MKITLLVVGKTEEKWLRDGIAEYEGRIRRYASFSVTEIPALRDTKSMPEPEQKKREAALILKQVNDGDLVVLLDEHGKETGSVQFAGLLNRMLSTGKKNLVFVVGGPYGFDHSVTSRADQTISLSRLTFPHQLVRLIFAEQLYRAWSLLHNHPYHR